MNCATCGLTACIVAIDADSCAYKLLAGSTHLLFFSPTVVHHLRKECVPLIFADCLEKISGQSFTKHSALVNPDKQHDLSCPCCLETVEHAPILMLPCTHSVCVGCLPRLSTCPICREDVFEQPPKKLYKMMSMPVQTMPEPCCLERASSVALTQKSQTSDVEFGGMIRNWSQNSQIPAQFDYAATKYDAMKAYHLDYADQIMPWIDAIAPSEHYLSRDSLLITCITEKTLGYNDLVAQAFVNDGPTGHVNYKNMEYSTEGFAMTHSGDVVLDKKLKHGLLIKAPGYRMKIVPLDISAQNVEVTSDKRELLDRLFEVQRALTVVDEDYDVVVICSQTVWKPRNTLRQLSSTTEPSCGFILKLEDSRFQTVASPWKNDEHNMTFWCAVFLTL